MIPPVFDVLRRRPDIEAPELVAVDAADRLLLDEAAPALAGADVAVIGDDYGAITLGALAGHHPARVRVHQDRLSGSSRSPRTPRPSAWTGSAPTPCRTPRWWPARAWCW